MELILQCATKNSLVIIDELGRGTSTYDGCGIAWAVAKHLAKEIQAFTLFATHYHEITQLESEIRCVSNYYVTMILTDNSITPLYSIKKGISDKSYGIQCAKVAEFPEKVIKLATEYLRELEHADGLNKIQHLDPLARMDVIAKGDDILESIRARIELKIKNNASKEELSLELKKIQQELFDCDNLFIQGLIGC